MLKLVLHSLQSYPSPVTNHGTTGSVHPKCGSLVASLFMLPSVPRSLPLYPSAITTQWTIGAVQPKFCGYTVHSARPCCWHSFSALCWARSWRALRGARLGRMWPASSIASHAGDVCTGSEDALLVQRVLAQHLMSSILDSTHPLCWHGAARRGVWVGCHLCVSRGCSSVCDCGLPCPVLVGLWGGSLCTHTPVCSVSSDARLIFEAEPARGRVPPVSRADACREGDSVGGGGGGGRWRRQGGGGEQMEAGGGGEGMGRPPPQPTKAIRLTWHSTPIWIIPEYRGLVPTPPPSLEGGLEDTIPKGHC